jgi:hypothetical protein
MKHSQGGHANPLPVRQTQSLRAREVERSRLQRLVLERIGERATIQNALLSRHRPLGADVSLEPEIRTKNVLFIISLRERVEPDTCDALCAWKPDLVRIESRGCNATTEPLT